MGASDLMDLALSPLVLNKLLHAGYRSVAEVSAASDEELLAIPRFRRVHLVEVRARLAGEQPPALYDSPWQEGRASRGARAARPTRGAPVSDMRLLPVERLQVGARTTQSLLDAGYKTAGDLLSANPADLAALPWLGSAAITRIEMALAARGLRWLGAGSVPAPEGDLYRFDLSVRLANCLRAAGFTRAAEVRAASDEELLALPGFGHGTLHEARQVLGRHGKTSLAEEAAQVGPVDGAEGGALALPIGSVWHRTGTVVSVLAAHGVDQVGDLVSREQAWVAALHGVGPVAVEALAAEVAWLGIRWNSEHEDTAAVVDEEQQRPGPGSAEAEATTNAGFWEQTEDIWTGASQREAEQSAPTPGEESASFFPAEGDGTEEDEDARAERDDHGDGVDRLFSPAAYAELAPLNIRTVDDFASWPSEHIQERVSSLTWAEVDTVSGRLRISHPDRARAARFADAAQQVTRFVEDQGALPRRDDLYGEARVGQWVMWVRTKKARNELDAYREWLTEQIPGWTWRGMKGIAAREIPDIIEAAEGYAALYGHLTVLPNEQWGDVRLRDRLALLRRNRTLLPDTAVTRLEALPGWTWDQTEADQAARERISVEREDQVNEEWVASRDALLAWAVQRGGIANVVTTDVDPTGRPVGQWLTAQRARRRSLKPVQVRLLEAIPGWEWDGMAIRDARRWNEAVARLERYVAEHGTSTVPAAFADADGFALGGWVSRQRRRRDEVSEDQRQRLEALPGWYWNDHGPREPHLTAETAARYDSDWEEKRAAVEAYIRAHGRPPGVAHVTEDGTRLGAWVVNQRSRNREGRLREDRVAALDATPGWVWRGQSGAAGRSANLYDLFQHGYLRAGDVLVPRGERAGQVTAAVTNDGLIEIAGERFNSPSEAQAAVRVSASTSGWDFWHLDRDGVRVPLRQIREECAAMLADRYPGGS